MTSGKVRIAEVSDAELDVAAHTSAVRVPAGGADVLFCGVVRDNDHERVVRELHYTAHPSAVDVLRRIAEQTASDPQVLAVAVSHRTGSLAIGDVALIAALSCAHRVEAFRLCAQLVDEIKAQLPIWKRQVFADGTDEWVNCP